MNTIMTIGGTDSSGGAGITRDAFVARTLGFDVLPIVTAVTAQSNEQVCDVQLMPADFVGMQIRAALASVQPAAIKIGMLGTGQIAEAVASAIAGVSVPVVIDPVLRSSSGGQLMSGNLPRKLLSQARVVTPNLLEAAVLTDRPVAQTHAQIAAQAELLLANGARAVLVKGGHAKGRSSTDHLFSGSDRHEFEAPRLTTTMRGTGCALATAIACQFARGESLALACQKAKEFVYVWLREEAKN